MWSLEGGLPRWCKSKGLMVTFRSKRSYEKRGGATDKNGVDMSLEGKRKSPKKM